MKLTCGVIKNLLPLYQEELCNEETKKLVEEHLKTCPACMSLLEAFKVSIFDLPATLETDKASAKVLERVKRRFTWRAHWKVFVLALVGALGIGVAIGLGLPHNEYDLRTVTLNEWEQTLISAGSASSMPFYLNEGGYIFNIYRFHYGTLIEQKEALWQMQDQDILFLTPVSRGYTMEWVLNTRGVSRNFDFSDREQWGGITIWGSIDDSLNLGDEETAIAFSMTTFENFLNSPESLQELFLVADFTQEHIEEFESFGDVFIVTIQKVE